MSAEQPAAVSEAIVADAQDIGFKAFVGNLAFATKDQNLRDIFEKVGPVKDAQVIHRGSRSLGYGFVTFSTEADAQKAVSTLDKTEISGRQINVELAKPPVHSKEGKVPKDAAKAAKKKDTLNHVKDEDKKEVSSAEAAEKAAAVDGTGVEGEKKKRNKNKRAKGRRPRADAETEEAGDAPVAATTTTDGEKPKRAPRTSTPREKRGPPTGEPSKTLLFVANLPFSVDDAALNTLFGSYKIASARVVTKKFGPGSGRSKGFGFVDFENEEEQKKAFEKEQGKEVEGREIQLKIAVNPEDRTDEAKPKAESKPKAKETNGGLSDAEATIVAS